VAESSCDVCENKVKIDRPVRLCKKCSWRMKWLESKGYSTFTIARLMLERKWAL